MNLYIIRYSHRHGHDVWPVFSTKAPTEDEIIEKLEEWEGEEKDEFIEISGPHPHPAEGLTNALRTVVNSYDNTGCEDCGVIDADAYEGAKKALGL